MNPGRSWFSVPSPYVIHDPMLGRTNVSLPVCSSSSAPPCREFEPCMPLRMHMSSTPYPPWWSNLLTECCSVRRVVSGALAFATVGRWVVALPALATAALTLWALRAERRAPD